MRVTREFLFDARKRIESRVKAKLVCSTDALDKFYLHKGGVIHLPYFNYESCDLGLALRSETKSGLKKLADEFALPFDEAAILG